MSNDSLKSLAEFYIAMGATGGSFDPKIVLSMIDEIDRLKAVNEKLAKENAEQHKLEKEQLKLSIKRLESYTRILKETIEDLQGGEVE